MSITHPTERQFADDLEEALLRFDAAWNADVTPELRLFRAASSDLPFLLELAHIDMERRVRAGLPVDIDSYLEALPELRAAPMVAEELARAEAELRRRHAGGTASAAARKGEARLTVATAIESLAPHARGGLGEVFLAQDPQLRRRLAVKVLQNRWVNDRRAVQDFVAEASLTSQLEHPGIVPVHGIGANSDGRPCYAMRFVEGDTLREAIRKFHESAWPDANARSLALRHLLTRFVAVCNTVAYAHDRGVVHRDLKPSNILLGKFGETLVLDWGMAKTVGAVDDVTSTLPELSVPSADQSTAQGDIKGTPAYLSPEQANGRWSEIGPATDVFGLGATLYTILTNAAPYDAPESSLEQARCCHYVPAALRDGRSPPELDAICRKAMAVLPADRYASALAVAQDVENWLAGERVVAWREPWRRSLTRWLRRHPAVAASLMVFAVVVPLAAIIGAWFVAQEQAQSRIDRQTAQVKEQAAAQITNYLVQVFQTADPLQLEPSEFHVRSERSEKSTLLRMLSRGNALVREHLQDQPLVRAGLLNAMGNTYCNLGDFEKAEALLTEGRQLRERYLEAEHADTMESLLGLARLYFQRGEYDKAEASFRLIRDWRSQRFGPDDLRTLRAQFHLAFALMYRPFSLPVNNDAELAEADRLLREVLAGQQRQLPSDHADIGHTLLLLAGVQSMLPGGNPKAEAYLVRALGLFSSNEKTTPFATLAIAYMGAEHTRTHGKLQDAERQYLEVLAMARQLFGDRHPMVGAYYANLAGLYRKMGKYENAAKALRTGLAIIEQTSIRSTPVVVDAIMQLADGVVSRDAIDAEKLYRDALRYARERPVVNQAIIATLESRLANLGKAPPAKQP